MLLALLLTSTALAEPQPVLAVGDGVVAAPPTATSPPDQTMPGGWLPVLADCLEERKPAHFTVVDRAVVGETVRSLQDRAGSFRDLRPAWLVVTLGSRELAADDVDPKALRSEIEGVLGALRGKAKKGRPSLVLVGLVPPTLAQVLGEDPARQAALDERTASFNAELAELAKGQEDVVLVDLWSDWPRDNGARAGLTVDGWGLSDQGHARVAAAVCDALLGR